MKAVVLVGGEGTRLRPLTLTSPKPLLPIANRPFLERQLEWLLDYGVDEVVLSLGYRADVFHEHFPNDRFGDVTLQYKVEDEPLGTAGAIKYAADGITERFLVCNGDVLTSLDLGAMVAFHDASGAEATISLSEVEDPSAFGVVPTTADGRVIAFVEKPPRERAPTKWINAGTYVLEPAFLDRIPPRLNVSVERETFPRMLEERGGLFAFKSDAYWLDIGTPEKYLQAHRDVLRGAVGGHAPSDLIMAVGSHVAPDAVVTRSVLGRDVHVASGAQVDGCVLLDGARVDEDAQLTNSIVGPGGHIERKAVLDDYTIVGANATVTAGTRLSRTKVGVGETS